MDPYRFPAASPSAPDAAPGEYKLGTRRAVLVRLAAVWGLLVVLALAVWLFSPDADTEIGALVVPVIAGLVAFAVVLTAVFYRQIIALVRQNNDAVALLAAGRLDEAERAFSDLVQRSERFPRYRALFLANVGVCRLRRGDDARALAYLSAAEQSGWLQKSSAVTDAYPQVLIALALCHANHGRLDEAARWQERARAHVSAARRGLLTPLDAALAARRGAHEEVVALTAVGWSAAEGVLGSVQMRGLRLLRAFALGQLPPTAERADEARSLVEGARPSQHGEFDHLCGEWPAFRAFLVEHGFTSP